MLALKKVCNLFWPRNHQVYPFLAIVVVPLYFCVITRTHACINCTGFCCIFEGFGFSGDISPPPPCFACCLYLIVATPRMETLARNLWARRRRSLSGLGNLAAASAGHGTDRDHRRMLPDSSIRRRSEGRLLRDVGSPSHGEELRLFDEG